MVGQRLQHVGSKAEQRKHEVVERKEDEACGERVRDQKALKELDTGSYERRQHERAGDDSDMDEHRPVKAHNTPFSPDGQPTGVGQQMEDYGAIQFGMQADGPEPLRTRPLPLHGAGLGPCHEASRSG